MVEGSIVRYEWDFEGDGTFDADTGADPRTTHAYARPFVGTARVRVTNDTGATANASATVDIRPQPPRGEVGVSINNGAIATNDPHVQISLVWPAFSLSALLANDGGFGASAATKPLPADGVVDWTLASSGSERQPKVVYVRFRGNGADSNVTFTDDIILDQTAPQVSGADLLEGSPARPLASLP